MTVQLKNGEFKMDTLKYETEYEPCINGVYACRVPSDLEQFQDDKFLTWCNGEWSHKGSPLRYRGDVLGWIGPLDRKKIE